MSEKTARELRDAAANETKLQAVADEAKRKCLSAVAAGLPARLDNVAKKAAYSQPEVAKALGQEGVVKLRNDLSVAADALASELTKSVDEIKWPTRYDRYSTGSSADIHQALSVFLGGSRVDRLAQIMKQAGFSIQDDNAQRAQMLLAPQDLYDRDGFTEVATALNSLAEAKSATKAARDADDRSTVDSLWDA